ncbi:MAG TPA: MarR family transcriptional regulator [Ardenticatenaceae bacterium]|nr:MarR family transcriptional regulator [Ardenticatenaceae bacterium]
MQHITTTAECLSDAQARFIRHWGEMANAWGIPRTMGEVHALLLVASEPLTTDDIMDKLQISRGNASMSLRGLQDWGLIRHVHRLGDRKTYYEAESDIWEVLRAIVRERKRREFDPTMRTLNTLVAQVQDGCGEEAETNEDVAVFLWRVGTLLDLMVTLDEAYSRYGNVGQAQARRLLEVEVQGL